MKIRKIRIWLSRGWYRVVCSVSLLLLPFFCATAKSSSVVSHAGQDTKDTLTAKKAFDRQALEDSTKSGNLIMCAYGTPWKGPGGIDVQVQQDTTLTRLSEDMLEKVLKYEKKSNPMRMTAYGPPYENGEEETVLDLRPSKKELRKARRAERKKKD